MLIANDDLVEDWQVDVYNPRPGLEGGPYRILSVDDETDSTIKLTNSEIFIALFIVGILIVTLFWFRKKKIK